MLLSLFLFFAAFKIDSPGIKGIRPAGTKLQVRCLSSITKSSRSIDGPVYIEDRYVVSKAKPRSQGIAGPDTLPTNAIEHLKPVQTPFESLTQQFKEKKLRLAQQHPGKGGALQLQKYIVDFCLEYENAAYRQVFLCNDSVQLKGIINAYEQNKPEEMRNSSLLQSCAMSKQIEYFLQMQINQVLFQAKLSDAKYSFYVDKDIIQIFDSVKGKYRGVLLDKLLLEFFDRDFRCNKTDSLLKVTLRTVQHQPEKTKLLSLHKRIGKGAPAYPFELSDTSGKVIRLIDLKGSVILVNTWIEHCGPCEGLNRNLKPIIERFEKSNDVKFVSLNADRQKTTWKDGIKSGRHTTSGQLLLHQNPDITYNNLLKYYQFTGFPNLLLIDKTGKIVSTRINRPNTKENLDALIDMIEKSR